MKKKLFESMKVDTNEILINRSGKVDGRMGEVRTGCGVWEDKRKKKPKYKKDWSAE